MTALDNSLDSILAQLGEFGTYQIFLLVVLSWGTTLHAAARLAFVFTAMDLEYRCEIPECETSLQFEPQWLSGAVPYSNGKPSKCYRYRSNNSISTNCSDFTTIQEKCDSFIYKTQQDSILKAYGLHCQDNLWKLTLVGTINSAGQFFGMFLSGVISDRFGRKIVFVVGLTLCGICGIIRTFIPTYTWFLVFEFLDATFAAGIHICGFIMGVELVGPKRRVLSGTLVNVCSSYGSLYVASSGWIFQAWKPVIYSIYGPLVLIIFYFWIIPESVRWNLSRGRLTEAKKTLRQVAKINRKVISEEILDQLDTVDESQSANSFFEVFKSRALVLRLVNCCFTWMTCGFVFYGLTLNSVTLAGNSYLDFMLTSLVEVPGFFSCIFLADKIGRKWTLSGSLFLAGGCCLVFLFIPKASYVGSLLVYLLGKFGITLSFVVAYLVTSELFPTPLRHSMMGACSTFGRVGSMVAPQTPLLAQIWEPLMMILFTAMAVVAGLLALLLPETLRIKLPDTIEEAVSIGKDQKN